MTERKSNSERLCFDITDRGFNIKAFWPEDHRDSRVEITRNGKPFRSFLYPAYKVFNLGAHFQEIVDGELENSDSGYQMAGSDGLGGVVMPLLLKKGDEE